MDKCQPHLNVGCWQYNTPELKKWKQGVYSVSCEVGTLSNCSDTIMVNYLSFWINGLVAKMF